MYLATSSLLTHWLTAANRYMSINYHLAELIQKVFTPEVSARKEHLLQARARYERFLKLLDSYDMLSKGDAKLFESYNEDKANFSTVSTKDAAARRDVKIARFREEKELKRKLEVCMLENDNAKIPLTYLCTVPATEPESRRTRRSHCERAEPNQHCLHGASDIPVA